MAEGTCGGFMEKLVKELEQYGEVQENVSFRTMTTLRIGGNARVVVFPKNILALTQILREIKEANVSYKLIGKGSNLLCSDDDYNGVVIRLDRTFTDHYFDHDICYAEAGCSIIALAYDAMKNSLSGLEFASGIPGTVGGVTFMNAGAYKSSMSEIIQEVFVLRDGQLIWMTQEECKFNYRTSIFQQHPDWVVLAVKLKLNPASSDEIRELMEQRRERRMSSQPLSQPSAGSVFRNPDIRPAWQYIEEIGYRGKVIGGACVSEKHVNFIVNQNHASANDYLQLVDEIKEKVKTQFGVELKMEVEKFNWQAK